MPRGSGLREAHKARTQRAIQDHAMRLFAERGYDATTVADVAAAAEVSSMTVFRYFPTKEHLVMADEYDPIIVERIQARPSNEPLMQRVGAALNESTANLNASDRATLLARVTLSLSLPALRARMWDGQYQTQCHIVEALRGDNGDDRDPENEFELSVATGACLTAATTAIMHWAEHGGNQNLQSLVAAALRIVIQSGPTQAGRCQ